MDESLNEKANSASQQRLMGMVYAYKSGKLDLDDLNDNLAEKIKKIADGSRRKSGDKRKFTKGMSTDDVLDFASTKHKGLPQKVEENNKTPMKKVMSFDEFINEAKNVDKFDNLEVELSSYVNPDDYQRKTVRPEIKSKRVKVSSIDDAVKKCGEFIDKNHLGGGNWDGGNIYSDDKLIGYISYNGRVWDKPGIGKKELKY